MFICLDKPTWVTSHDCVEKIRRIYIDQKVGHGGTLDPLATWLLVIAVGADTKKLWQLLGADKTYHATIDFSVQTDTWDTDYWKVYHQWPVDLLQQTICIDGEERLFPSKEQFDVLFSRILGTHLLPLTPFSAKKYQGKKLYEYARAWTPIYMDVPMCLKTYRIIEYTFPQISVELTVGSGTYIRSLAYRIGKQVGLWWTLTMLRRIAVGNLLVPH